MEDIKIRSLRDRQKEKMQKTEDFFKGKIEPETVLAAPVPKKLRNVAKKIAKFIVFAIFVFFIGGLGGIWLDRIFFPTLLVEYPQLNQYDYLKRVSERTTIVRETQEVKISQEEAISDTIDKVSPAVAEVLVKTVAGQFQETGSGIILTSDGYMITPLQNIFTKNGNSNVISKDIQIKLKDGRTYAAQVAAQNANYSLAILKISENNLSVIPYSSPEDLKLGQKLIIINSAVTTDIISRFVDDYKMPGSTDSALQKRIQIAQKLDASSTGSAVISVDGKLVGVEQGENIVIPISEIKDFIDKSVAAK
jgi:S1-C subfamily serine protease